MNNLINHRDIRKLENEEFVVPNIKQKFIRKIKDIQNSVDYKNSLSNIDVDAWSSQTSFWPAIKVKELKSAARTPLGVKKGECYQMFEKRKKEHDWSCGLFVLKI